MGKSGVDLFTYDPPALQAEYSFEVPWVIPIGEFPVVVTLKADFSAKADFKFGYDTHGLDLYAESGNLADVFAGFFADESESKVRVDGEFTIGIGAGWVGLNIGGRGGLFAEATADLRDPDGDGKVRVNELLENLGRRRSVTEQ